MNTLERTAAGISSFTASLASLLKVAIRSRKPFPASAPNTKPLIILGNGPSLRGLLDSYSDTISRLTSLAVNFAANTPEFRLLRPAMYVMADPHFFNAAGRNPNVARLQKNLAAVDWSMTLYIPVGITPGFPLPECVKIKHFNTTPAEGIPAVSRMLFNCGLAMPRPRNVLIPSIMIALREGFRDIYLAGADHSWSRTISVDDDNHVISVQPHFYKDDAKEQKRVDSEYAGIPLHNIFQSMSVAFRSYFDINRYAGHLGARIINITPGSFIDAFPREPQENALQRLARKTDK